MNHSFESPIAVNYFLEPGFIFIADKPTFISSVLGSCVSITLYDKKRKFGGMNHFKLPITRDKHQATPIYGNVATIALIRMMLEDGSKLKHLEAQIFGGAYNRKISDIDIGRENIQIARRILVRENIRVVSEDTGGEKGRKVVFNTENNEIAVMKVEKLRVGDWYPYHSDR